MYYLLAYLIIVNAIDFLLMHIDKQKARRKAWRIPEATLIGVAIVGGSIGAYLGMHVFRHKTRHTKFTVGIPAIFIVQILLTVIYYIR